MAKFDLAAGGYKLECSGKIVTPSNVEELNPDEIQELAETLPSGWDFLMLRKKLHVVENSISAYITNADSMFLEIKDALTVTVKNGTEQTMSIGKVVAGMYEREAAHRKRILLITALKLNKVSIIIFATVVFLGLTFILRNDWFLSGLIPVVITIIKELISKK
ncbi:MAG: hypothetical protein WC879_03340 [Melioribacteraceae bacterium]